ncbi:hypothetical protein HOBO_245 [Bacillus phage Hobo]|uniref:Uncharacterized protein n=2 Tax=Caeruleovirus BM15 TaxID=1985178 RepID=A0A0S2MV07_9CAUD|nr:hypothetical protein FD732_gp096 [Bacillus phage BM15]ALO79653.1 hypothetical protein BM10_249 [Bacillus phage BM15]AXQ67000.1 hypothetical protein HOBO_245 [Bacillus phage Hobo]
MEYMSVMDLWKKLDKLKDTHPDAEVVLGQHTDPRTYWGLVDVKYDPIFDTVDLHSRPKEEQHVSPKL